MDHYTEISHDPFARQSIVRRTDDTRATCSWCGQKPTTHKLFEYGIEDDSRPGRVNWAEGYFCSIGCMRDYHRL